MASESGKAVTPSRNTGKKKIDTTGDEQFWYQSAVGAPLYLSTGSRPDIAYVVIVAWGNVENPSPVDFIQDKHVFRYLQGTND